MSHYVDRIRKEVSSSRVIQHPVFVVPFSDKLGTTSSVTNAQESQQFFQDQFMHEPKLLGGGTNIQAALHSAFKLIRENMNGEGAHHRQQVKQANI